MPLSQTSSVPLVGCVEFEHSFGELFSEDLASYGQNTGGLSTTWRACQDHVRDGSRLHHDLELVEDFVVPFDIVECFGSVLLEPDVLHVLLSFSWVITAYCDSRVNSEPFA